MTQSQRKSVFLGIAAAIGASVIGSAWQIASRHAVTTTLDPLALAVLRYCVPTLLLLPILLRIGLFPPGLSRRRLAVLIIGGGLPFVLVGLTGARFAPVAHMGILLASVMPVFTAILMWVFYRDPVSAPRILGFSLIAIGVAVLGQRALSTMDSTTLAGEPSHLGGGQPHRLLQVPGSPAPATDHARCFCVFAMPRIRLRRNAMSERCPRRQAAPGRAGLPGRLWPGWH